MPTYDYKCKECDHQFAIFHSMSEEARKMCPQCGKPALIRLIGTGAGIIFKGGGFYETDYKRKAQAPPTSTNNCETCCPKAKECPMAKNKDSGTET